MNRRYSIRRILFATAVSLVVVLTLLPFLSVGYWFVSLTLRNYFAEQAVKRNEYQASTLEYEGIHSYNTSFDLDSHYYLTHDSKSDVLTFYTDRNEHTHIIDGDALEWEEFTSLDEFVSDEGYRMRNTSRVMLAHEAQCSNISFECFSTMVLTMPDESILIIISYWVFGL
jgi:hypothetical protein